MNNKSLADIEKFKTTIKEGQDTLYTGVEVIKNAQIALEGTVQGKLSNEIASLGKRIDGLIEHITKANDEIASIKEYLGINN